MQAVISKAAYSNFIIIIVSFTISVIYSKITLHIHFLTVVVQDGCLGG